jgi:hypothetical protein
MIVAEAALFALLFRAASTASTVYVWLEPAASPVSVKDNVVVWPTAVAPPSR